MTNPADGAPLTRRQLRELAEAEAAKAAQNASGPQGSQGVSAPQQAPQSPQAPAQSSYAQQPLTRTVQPASQPSQQMPLRQSSSAPAQPITRSAGSPTSQPGGLPSRQSVAAPAADQPGMPRRTAAAERTIPAGAGTGYVAAGQASPGQPLSRVEQIRSQQSQAVAQSSGSRRAIRELAEPPAAVILPPRQTGKIRTLDETGELGAMRAHSPAAPSLPPRSPAAQAPSAPVRRTSAVGAQPGAAREDVPPAFAPGSAPAAGTPWAGADLPPTRQGRGQAGPDTGQSWQPGGFDENPWASVAPRSEAPATQSPAAPVLPADGAPFAVPPVPGEELPPELPQWDAITAGGPAHGDVDEDVLDLDEDDIEVEEFVEPDHKYTWLHYLILIAVAFVFGLIIWKVGFENRAEGLSGTTDEISTAGVPGLSLIEDFL